MWLSRDVGRLTRRRRLVAAVAASVLLSMAVAGVVFAAGGSDNPLQVTRTAADPTVEQRVDRLISQMTLDEKLEQIQLLPDFMVTEDEVRKGLGSVLSLTDP